MCPSCVLGFDTEDMCAMENKSSETVSVYVDAELRARLEKYAADEERSVSFVIRKAIEAYLTEQAAAA